MKLALAFICALALPASAAEMPSQKDIDAARNSVLQAIFDPAPVFPDVVATTYNGHTIFCGYVNARNRFGGYTGQKPFMVMGAFGGSGIAFPAEIVDDAQNTFGYERKVALLRSYCSQDDKPVHVKFGLDNQ